MKKFFLLTSLSLVALFGLQSCKDNGPKEAAEKFLTAMVHMDYEKAKEYGTAETDATVDMMAQFSSMYPDSLKAESKKIKVNIQEVKEEGDKAVVTYNTSDDPANRTIEMVKEDGEWRAQFNKADPGSATDMDATQEPLTEEVIDTTIAPPVEDTAIVQ